MQGLARLAGCAAMGLALMHVSACEILDPTPRWYAEEYETVTLDNGVSVDSQYGVWTSSGIDVAHGWRYFANNSAPVEMCVRVEISGLRSSAYVTGRLDSWKRVPAGSTGFLLGSVETEMELLSEYDENFQAKRAFGGSCE